MTYFGFLLRFLVVPILVLSVLADRDRRQGCALPSSLRLVSPWLALVALAIMAVIYTTPWDNYLVATEIWWYDPALVTGITLGWVPLEEYVFFVLQTVMTGLWSLFLARRVRVTASFIARRSIRIVPAALVGMVWMGSIVLLLMGWKPAKYLSLELAWALPVIGFQLAFGGDIFWHYRRLLVPAIVTMTLYYSGMDVLAIQGGTWTINPTFSLGIALGGVLPIEEVIFFLLTNTILVFGLVLCLANESFYRLPSHTIRMLSNHKRERHRRATLP